MFCTFQSGCGFSPVVNGLCRTHLRALSRPSAEVTVSWSPKVVRFSTTRHPTVLVDGLSRPERQVAWAMAAKNGDRDAAAKLLKDTNGLCWKFVRKYSYGLSTEDINDMRAEVDLTLLKYAIPKFENRHGAGWVTYAGLWIRQACSRWRANTFGEIRIPVYLRQTQAKVRKFVNRCEAEPLDAEVCEAVGITRKELDRARQSAIHVVSIDTPVGNDDGDRSLHDVLATPSSDEDDQYEERVARLREAIEGLRDDRLRRIMRSRANGKTHKAIGLKMGLSRERVRQLEAEAVAFLRWRLTDEPADN